MWSYGSWITTTCAVSPYHHQSCEFEPCSWWGVLDATLCDKVCQWLATGQWFFSGYLRNNSTVFEELEVSIVDLMVTNAVLLATRSGASKTDICDRQIHNWHLQLFKYSTDIPILMKFSQRVHTSLKTYK